MHAMHEVPLGVKLSASAAMLLGLLGAYVFYIRAPEAPRKLAATYRPIYLFLLNKWYFDELYNLLFVRPAFALGRFCGAEGIENVTAASAFRSDFGTDYGVTMTDGPIRSIWVSSHGRHAEISSGFGSRLSGGRHFTTFAM